MGLPAFFSGDRVADVYLNAALPALLILFLIVIAARIPALRTSHAPTGTTSILGCSYAVCSLLLAASYVAELVLDPEAKRQDVPNGTASPNGMRGFYLFCITCGVCVWLTCGCLALAEAWNGRYVGRSMRLWLMLAALHAFFRFASDVDRLSSKTVDLSDTLVVVRLAAFVLALGFGLAALCQPDSPSDASYGRSGGGLCSLSVTQGRVAAALLSTRLLPEGGPAEGLGSPKTAAGEEEPQMGARNTEATASYWSRYTFSWLSGILQLGSRRALEQSDLYRLQTEDATGHNEALLTKAWRAEERRRPGAGVFLRAFHAAYGGHFWVTGFFQVVNTALLFANPLLINLLTRYLSDELVLSPTAAVTCALAMFLANSAKSLALGREVAGSGAQPPRGHRPVAHRGLL